LLKSSLPSEIRQLCRDKKLDTPTSGLAPDYIQANLVVLPYSLAFDFLLFCQRNPKPCPILDITETVILSPSFTQTACYTLVFSNSR